MSHKFVLLFLIICTPSALSRSSGATVSTCDTMMPRHQLNTPQEGSPPVSVTVLDQIAAGSQISVKITSTSQGGFRGFKILARDQNNNLVGRFSDSEEIRTLLCGEMEGSAATQSNGDLKREIVLLWQAPSSTQSLKINFHVTIVESFEVFWVDYKAPSNLIASDDAPIDNSDTTTNDGLNDKIDSIYQGCDKTKTCFGIPKYCVKRNNCEFLGAVSFKNSEFEFELLSMNNHNYIAFGLSNTQSMSDSSAIECVRQQDRVAAYTSWTIGTIEAQRSVDQNIIELIESSIVNGRIYCKVKRIPESIVRGITFNLINNTHYLLLASGADVQQNSVGMHENEGLSAYPILLTIPQNVNAQTSKNPLKLTHGATMFIAWLLFTPIGIVIARYFKNAWPKGRLFGKDVWFIWHVLCMFLTMVFTITGFVLILIYRGYWRTSIHSVMGCIVLAFTVLQPFGAIFRPEPHDDSRPLFNWLHKAFGNITHGLAIITMFFAVQFPRAGLPYYTYYILAAFVSFYLLMHIIFMSINICSEMKLKYKFKGQSDSKPYQLLQKTLLGFFIILLVALVSSLNVIFIIKF